MTGQTISPLAADILPSVNAIAEYVYGAATPTNVRRVRHQIDTGGLPIKRRGARIESRKTWIDALYSQPDAGNGSSK